MKKSILITLLVLVTGYASCATFPKRPFPDGKIVGGWPVNIEDYPYQCSLMKGGKHFCGAVLISSNKALTAAHCTNGVQSLQLRCGSTSQYDGGIIIDVKSVCQHPDYNPSTINNDVSELFLETAVSLTPIMVSHSPHDPEPGSLLQVLGWGTTQDASQSNEFLRAVTVPTVSHQQCNDAYVSHGGITDNMICAGDMDHGGKDSCQGDSGGPIVDILTKELVGIVSWGLGCAQKGFPGVYTNIRMYADWISDPSKYCAPR